MDKNIKRDAPRWNSGDAAQSSQGEGLRSKDVRPLPVKASRSRSLSGLSGYEETHAARALDDEHSDGAQGRRSSSAPATGSPRRRALSAAPSGNHRALEATRGPIDRFAEEQIARLNAQLDAAGAGVSAAIHGAPRWVTRESRSELPIAGPRELHDGSRLGSREVLESAARQVSAIVDDLDAQLHKTRHAASKALPQRKAARNPAVQIDQVRADARRQSQRRLDARTALDEIAPDPMDAYQTRIVGLHEAWELAQHATRAVKRALNAAPSGHGPETGTPEVQRFAEELAGQANHALTQLYQALEAVPKMPNDGPVS